MIRWIVEQNAFSFHDWSGAEIETDRRGEIEGVLAREAPSIAEIGCLGPRD